MITLGLTGSIGMGKSATARTIVRLISRTSGAPASFSTAAAPRAAPPAPRITTGPRRASKPGACPVSAASRPAPSVLSARIWPPGSNNSRLAAPARRAAALGASASASASSLNGTVTLRPRTAPPARPLANAVKPFAAGAKAT